MYILPTSLRIGVLRGGPDHAGRPSPQYDISLRSGGAVLKYLAETYRPIDIFISRDGTWHMQGIERSPERILQQVDVVWNALHGPYGEDGTVQELLDSRGARYTGSARLASALALNKVLTKERAKAVGIKTPLWFLVRQEDSIEEKANLIASTLPFPMIVKPTCSGSSFGLYKVNSFPELTSALETVLSEHGSAIVEEFITGKEATCCVVDQFRGNDTYVLPPVELVRPAGKDILDFDTKYDAKSILHCPGNFSTDEKKSVEEISRRMHQTLGLSHYSQSDFIVSPRRGVYFLEVGTIPTILDSSIVAKALESIGSTMPEFLHHIIALALNEK